MNDGAVQFSLLLSVAAGNNGYAGAVICAVAVILVACVAYSGWRYKDDFRIEVKKSRVRFRGRIPPGKQAAIGGFLLNDLAPGVSLLILGNWTPDQILRVDVKGKVSKGEAQRIRNFLKITLKG